MEKKWSTINVNEIKLTTGDKVKNLYPTFNKYKFAFKKNYDIINMKWIDFNKFYNDISKLNNDIAKFINVHFNIEWDITDTDKWLMTCFFKYNGKKIKNDGYVIELLKNNQFETGFCSLLKQILVSEIMRKIYYNNNNKYSDLVGDEKMNNLVDLKDCFDDIETIDKFDEFTEILKPKEKRLFNLALFSAYKDNKIDIDTICRLCGISKRTYYTTINKIKNKYIDFKDNKID